MNRFTIFGMGLMGRAIAKRLTGKRLEVSGWNRPGKNAEEAMGQGINVTGDLAKAIADGDCLILMLSDFSAIRACFDDREELGGKLVIQMGTIAPQESRQLEQLFTACGARYIEAPVLGSIPEALNGSLIIMAGGSSENFETALPVLELLGGESDAGPRLIGAVGQGAAMKLAMNQLIGTLTAGFSMSLGMVRSEGIDIEQFMELLRNSALYAPTYDKKLGKMLNHDYANPNFPLRHLLKDMRLFRESATILGIDATLLEPLEKLLEKGCEESMAELDYSALYEVVNRPREK